MAQIDINCDMGEGIGNDALLMPYISSANIACGYHAGNEATMEQAIQLALAHQVAIGAHPSYFDRDNFGRSAIDLPPAVVYDIVRQQVTALATICTANNTTLCHVKPHGALYNTAAVHLLTAEAIVAAVKDCNENLILYGLPGSCLQQAATELGIAFCGEAFADRTYQPNGTLTPRQQADALITTTADATKQALQLIQTKTITAVTGETIAVSAGTICIHGDGVYALEFARAIHTALSSAGIAINKYEHR